MVAVLNFSKEGFTMPNPTQNPSIEYDVITYVINHPLSMSPGIYHEPLVWDIPTLEQARELLAQIKVKGAKIVKSVEFYYSDQEAQNRRLSALADNGITTRIEVEQLTNATASGVTHEY
jgi:hypothetical protein